ncbi:hyoscyamine 6-dioxygenase [Cajanus cajan]|uniref:Hyoscyamine 6-dioxygenase n=1 Tax=Cajanus cajan TaxID=3821 RepID=A0A151QRI4_CAJCA|nr:hyoscyamine 6-dioxygenase [Cajanus cajan]XP_020208040.1 hyoscyamine 6-dioxygenase [Cajanus cajan]XP_020208041.1 hyoscyamine 6-dioxygenase [Cajanus cajan]KYP32920.1 Hyoscyamine 6-dioxygenase [Cajanus cajan]
MNRVLLSSWFHDCKSVPLSHVQPPESRPHTVVASGNSIPVVDLGALDHAQTLTHLLKASHDFGFFHVINHGVSKELMDDIMNIFKEFHGMPAEEKLRESSRDPNGNVCKLYTSREKNNKDFVQFWRDTFKQLCPPSGQFIEYWPQNPPNYREVVAKYVEEMRRVGNKILELLCEGLGLDPKYCCGELSDNPLLIANHYPPCPEPSLTLGASKHRDPTLVTILLQQNDISALHVLKDGEWIDVHPIPYAFVVNIGLMFQIISNGRVMGAEHRVVTNAGTARTTVAYFVCPTNEKIVEPAKPLTMSGAPPMYKSIRYEEFMKIFLTKGADIEPLLLL